jgi:hypothetical protein
MSPSRPPHPLSADRPIRSKSEDLLGRSTFADSLAAVVKGWTGNDSLAMALYGPWGIGKSSIKNMMLDKLRDGAPDAPIVVEFNPWQWAAQDQLADAFFRELGVALGKKDKSREAKKIAARLAAYAGSLKLGAPLVSGVRLLLSAAFGLAAVLGLGGLFQPPWLKPYLGALALTALALAALTGLWASFSRRRLRHSPPGKTYGRRTSKRLKRMSPPC